MVPIARAEEENLFLMPMADALRKLGAAPGGDDKSGGGTPKVCQDTGNDQGQVCFPNDCTEHGNNHNMACTNFNTWT